jgi:hypothetical protein
LQAAYDASKSLIIPMKVASSTTTYLASEEAICGGGDENMR